MTFIQQIQEKTRAEAAAKGISLARTTLSKEVDGVTLTMRVAPCSWMYPGHGLQVQVAIENGGDVCIHEPSIPFEEATEAVMFKLFDQVKLVKCSKCGGTAFDPIVCKTNRAGQCEACFLTDLKKKFDKENEKEVKRMARLDSKRKEEGFTHRIDAWIHPENGSDYPMSMWVKGKPTKKLIQEELRKKKSCVLDDYTITAL